MGDSPTPTDDLLVAADGRTPALAPTTAIAGTFLPPVPLDWLLAAVALPGAALSLALVIWLEYRLNDSPETFHVRSRWRQAFGVSRHAERRALNQLEAAGLIAVERRRGARPRIRILEVASGRLRRGG